MLFLSGTGNDNIGIKIGQWFAEQTKSSVTAPYSAICWFKNEKPVAATIFNSYNGSSVVAHFYGPRYLTRGVISNVYDYAFNQLKCNILLAIIPRNNAFKSLLPRMGFKYLIVVPKYFGPNRSDDGIMYVLHKEQALKWVNTYEQCTIAA